MIGAGPQLSYAAAGGATQIASEVALDVEPQQVVLGQAEAADGWFGL
jgi:hypothetical protein